MTEEQYYWYVRRPQLLKAANFNNYVVVGCGDNSTKISSSEQLKEALKNGGVLKLTNPINLPPKTESILIEKNTTIDLNNQTISATELSGISYDSILSVKRGGTLTLNGKGVVDASKSNGKIYAALKLTVKGESNDGDYAKVVINDGTYQATYYAITGNGTRDNTDITINNGIFKGIAPDSTSIYHPQDGKMIINSGTFSGADCIVIKSGDVKINGGVFKSFGVKKDYKHDGNGWSNTGDCFVVEASDYSKSQPTIEITGGVFISENGKPIASYSQEGYDSQRVVKFVKGGVFNKPIEEALIADGFKQIQSDDMWKVVKI